MELAKKYWYVIAIIIVGGVFLYMRHKKTGKWFGFDDFDRDGMSSYEEYGDGDDEYAGGKFGKKMKGHRPGNKMIKDRIAKRKAARTGGAAVNNVPNANAIAMKEAGL